jgi:hypothetical protein
MAGESFNPPPVVAIGNYPSLIAAVAVAVLTAMVLLASGRLDPTHGPLTISIMIVLTMIAVIAYVLVFTVPVDEITPSVVGGLTAGFGAVLAYWLGRQKDGGDKPPPPPDLP